jgi:hypothetical protein
VRSGSAVPRPVAVWLIWRRAEREASMARWWHHWRLGDGAFFVHLGCTVGMVGIEVTFWPERIRGPIAEALEPARLLTAGALAWSLAVLAAGNVGWALRVCLGRRSSAVRPMALAALAALSAPPLLGLLVLPLWKRMESRRPEYGAAQTLSGAGAAARPRAGAAGLAAASQRVGRDFVDPAAAPGPVGTATSGALRAFGLVTSGARALARRLESAWVPLFWLGPANLLWVIAAAAWLAARAGRPPLPPAALLAAAASLHLLAFAAALIAAPQPALLEPAIRRRRWFELLWLLPSPVPQAWWLAALQAGLDRRRGATLAHSALLGRGFARGTSTGALLAERVRAGWRANPAWKRWLRRAGPAANPELDGATRRYLAVARWKTAGLALDGFALAAVAGALGVLPTGAGQPLPGWAWTTFVAGAVTVGAAVLLWAGHQVARWLEVGGVFAALDRLPYLRTMALGQLSLLLGLFWGIGAALEERNAFVVALAHGWALAVILVTGGTFLNPGRLAGTGRRDPADPWFWLGLFTLVPLLVAALVGLGGGPGPRVAVAVLAVASSLAWGAVVVRAGRFALCHPLEPRHLREHTTPAALRAGLRFVLITGALPLGGLLVPVWLVLRERNRSVMSSVAAGSREVPCAT